MDNVNAALELYKHAGSQYHESWVLFVAVIFGVTTFAFTKIFQGQGNRVRLFFTFVFLLFVVASWGSMSHAVDVQRSSLTAMLKNDEIRNICGVQGSQCGPPSLIWVSVILGLATFAGGAALWLSREGTHWPKAASSSQAKG
jgi:hypothetical protein